MSEKFRIEKKSNFTVVSNDILMNNFMSMKATCLLMNNYYRLATRVSEDFPNLAQGLKKQMANRLRGLTRNGKLERGFIKERYGKSKQLRFLNGYPLIPVGYVQTRDAQHKKKTVNRYTPEGRAEIHKNLGINTDTMIWLMRTPVLD